MALKIVGALLVALPFVAPGVMVVRELGWREVAVAYGVTAAVVVSISAGLYLMGVPL